MFDKGPVSKLGLGTLKFGRNFKVKYPGGEGAALPTPEEIDALLIKAHQLGINILDTAPSYGLSEQRIGEAMQRTGLARQFYLSSKVGEFQNGNSLFYSSDTTLIRKSLEESLIKLKTSQLDYLFLHHDNLINEKVIQCLLDMKAEKIVSKIGVSLTQEINLPEKIRYFDAVFVPYNINFQNFSAYMSIERTAHLDVFVKRPLGSGLIKSQEEIRQALQHLARQDAITTCMVSTSSLNNLESNCRFFCSK